MEKSLDERQVPTESTFAERFAFSRDAQTYSGGGETDEAFALAIGASAGTISAYRIRDEAPPSVRVLAIAERCGVDPGWLEFGAKTQAPAPPGFDQWLEKQRQKKHAERKKPPEGGFGTRRPTPKVKRAGKKR